MPHPETQVSAEKTAAKSEKKPVKPTAHFAALHSEITEALNIAEFGVPAQGQPLSQRGVLIETSRNRLTLSTFDFWTAVSVNMPVGTPVAKGYSLLDFTELKALAAMVAGETKAVAARTPVSLAGDLLATEHITVPIATLDIHEFTHPPEAVPAMATMDAQTFLAQLNRVLPTAGRDDTLPALTGVQMTMDGETLTMAATDRYRFAVAEVTAHATVQPPEKPLTSLIPAGVLAPLVGTSGPAPGVAGHPQEGEGVAVHPDVPYGFPAAVVGVRPHLVVARPVGRLLRLGEGEVAFFHHVQRVVGQVGVALVELVDEQHPGPLGEQRGAWSRPAASRARGSAVPGRRARPDGVIGAPVAPPARSLMCVRACGGAAGGSSVPARQRLFGARAACCGDRGRWAVGCATPVAGAPVYTPHRVVSCRRVCALLRALAGTGAAVFDGPGRVCGVRCGGRWSGCAVPSGRVLLVDVRDKSDIGLLNGWAFAGTRIALAATHPGGTSGPGPHPILAGAVRGPVLTVPLAPAGGSPSRPTAGPVLLRPHAVSRAPSGARSSPSRWPRQGAAPGGQRPALRLLPVSVSGLLPCAGRGS
jgi:hypothetical protein